MLSQQVPVLLVFVLRRAKLSTFQQELNSEWRASWQREYEFECVCVEAKSKHSDDSKQQLLTHTHT